MTYLEKINNLQKIYDFKIIKPLPHEKIERQLSGLGLSSDFLEFYKVTNGLNYEWFVIFPLEDVSNIKNTWDSIQRANSPEKSKFGFDEAFLDRFVIFAEIGAGECGVFDKSDHSIWFETSGQFQKTDMNLANFIEICLREVQDL